MYRLLILLFSGDLSNTDPQNFIYVELNAILQANAVVLAQLFKLLGNQAKFKHYNDIGHRFQIGINAVSEIEYLILYSCGVKCVSKILFI